MEGENWKGIKNGLKEGNEGRRRKENIGNEGRRKKGRGKGLMEGSREGR